MQNTGLGWHYFNDEEHYSEADAQKWLPVLKSLGAQWLTLVGSLNRAIPEAFVRAVVAHDIQPVIHLTVKPIAPLEQETLATLCRSYARWGARYMVVYDRPNTRSMWALGEWGKPDLIQKFCANLAACFETIKAHDLTPVFTPLKQGGDYWDTAFLENALTCWQQTKPELLDDLIFGVYGFAGNRPIDWGAGGALVWSQTRPYLTPPNSQDQQGFRAFEWYQDVIMGKLGKPHALLMIAGGAVIGGATDAHFAALTSETHAAHNAAIADLMLQHQLPDYLMNVSFWSLDTWFVNQKPLPVVPALQEKLKAAPQNKVRKGITPPQPKAAPPINQPKNLYHYVLLPTFEWGASDWHWHAAMEYVRAFQPVCGFSVEEAQHAEHVTIVGNEQGVAKMVEVELSNLGCKVERVCGKDGADTKRKLNDMAKANKRFLA